MTKRLVMTITVSSDTESDIDLEILREYKELTNHIRKGAGCINETTGDSKVKTESRLTIDKIEERGLQVDTMFQM